VPENHQNRPLLPQVVPVQQASCLPLSLSRPRSLSQRADSLDRTQLDLGLRFSLRIRTRPGQVTPLICGANEFLAYLVYGNGSHVGIAVDENRRLTAVGNPST